MKLVSLKQEPYLKALIYGNSGSGKTYLIGTFMGDERSSPVLVLNAGGQPITFRLFDRPPLVLTVETTKDFNEPYKWILAGQPYEYIESATTPFAKAVLYYFGACDANSFKTIAIDSVTHVQRIGLRGITGSTNVLPGDVPPQTKIQDWGRALAQLTNLADLYYQLPLHVIITALQRHNEVPTLGDLMFYPFIWGQSALEVPSHAELVGRLLPIASLRQRQIAALEADKKKDELANARNILLTRGGRNYDAKWQGITNAPDFVLAPTATNLLDYLYEDV